MGRLSPTYELEPVAEVPANVDRRRNGGGPRETALYGVLNQIAEDESKWGEWFRVCTYATRAGAKQALKGLLEGNRKAPAGEWEFESRAVEVQRDDEAVITSALFARYMGNS